MGEGDVVSLDYHNPVTEHELYQQIPLQFQLLALTEFFFSETES